MSTGFKFVEGPPSMTRGRNRLYQEFRDALRSRAGEWAQYPRAFKNKTTARVTAGNIMRGNGQYPAGEFEAVARDAVVYVRYVGGAK